MGGLLHKVSKFLSIAVQFLDFSIFFLSQLPHSAFSVTGKPFPLVHDVEQASSTASRSRALDRRSAVVPL